MSDEVKRKAIETAIEVSKKVLRKGGIPEKDLKRFKDNIISMEKRLKTL